MKKLLEFGRKAMFYIRVLSGYEERRIRSYRLQLQQRLQEAEQRKEEVRKMPEQVILSEVRRMVEEMQALNKKLEDTWTGNLLTSLVKVVIFIGKVDFPLVWSRRYLSASEFPSSTGRLRMGLKTCFLGLNHSEMAINEYFKPLDQQAEEVVKMQLKGDEKRKDELIEAMQRQAILEMAQAEKQKNMRMLNTNKHVQEKASTETLNQKKDNFVEN
ncbi:putative LRR receptor-like serine/threonine-protein kinase-like isoform X1 [Capsicum annuum]|nr:putative LRR receptor-like serine/threonine-protein kinase-like isoform X1 [Capsicum annuum]